MGIPLLGRIPRLAPAELRDPPSGLVMLRTPDGVASEAYRALRTNIHHIATLTGVQSILVTSSGPSEGKTSISANLGIALAQIGLRVALVSADLRRPLLDDMFAMRGGEQGLSSWLEGAAVSPSVTTVPGLSVIPSGPRIANPAEMLTSRKLGELCDELKAGFDYVILDSPPVLTVSDALSMAPQVDATLLVINDASTKPEAAVEAKIELDRIGSQVIGCVINACQFARGERSYRYGGYLYARSSA